ncbi:hypothetical protein FRC02_001090 [Tulasnella sp. 418]|nr:hypothetical protein FRC02_001090 [Tulasnella sp. 418]
MMLTQDDSIPINGVNIPLSPTIYSTLLLHTLRRREFLPNLRKVWWTVIPSSSSHFIVSVLHDSVIHLSITFSKVGEGIGYFLEDLQGRTKNIRTLSIKLRPSVARDLIKCQGSLIELLQQSPNLVEIFLPQFSLSPPIVVALGSLPHLKSLQLSDGGAFDPVTYDPGAKFDINASTFPMLEHLAYNSALGNAKRMFENWDRTSSLTSLCITSHGWKPAKNGVNQFLTALVKASPALSSLKLNLFMRPSENPDPLDSTDLFPLSQLHLTELKIGHNHPIILSAGDLDWMGAWTTLQVLSLNPDPLVPSLSSPPKGMGIETLSSIATLFPSLHHLGAFVSVESGFGLFSAESPLDLRVLDLGTSILPAESVDAVASFLASLVLDPDVSFRTGPSHWNPLPSLNLCREMWQEARRQMPKYARSQRRFREMFQHAKRDKRAAELKAEALKEEHAKATAELAKTKEENVILRSQVSSAEQSNYNLAQKVASLQQQLSSLGVAPNDV